jgi:hypothetical protein
MGLISGEKPISLKVRGPFPPYVSVMVSPLAAHRILAIEATLFLLRASAMPDL